MAFLGRFVGIEYSGGPRDSVVFGKTCKEYAESIELCCCFLEFFFSCGDSSDIRIALNREWKYLPQAIKSYIQRGIYTKTKEMTRNRNEERITP